MATKKPAKKPVEKKEDSFAKSMIDLQRRHEETDEAYLKRWTEQYVWITSVCIRLKLEPKPIIANIKKLLPQRFRKDELPLIYPEDMDYALVTFLPTSPDVNTNEVLKAWAGIRKYLTKNDIHIAVLD